MIDIWCSKRIVTPVSSFLICLLVLGLLSVPVSSQNLYGPRTPYMAVHLDSTFEDFVACKTDIVGWQLIGPLYPYPNVEYKSYVPVKQVKFYLNNQRWPTGVSYPVDYDPETGTYKHYYGTSPWDPVAKEFRKAIAHLTDKQGYLRRILNGYGWIQETEIPVPALSGYTDYAGLQSQGLIYNFDRIRAAQILDAAGFVMGTTPNPYYDPAIPGSAQFIRIDPQYGGDLSPLDFYIRLDDVTRRDAGLELTTALRTAGIPVSMIMAGKEQCFQAVMELYIYHLYTAETIEFPASKDEDTGRWLQSVDAPDHIIYAMWHSSQYWGGSGGHGWSSNYAGFCDEIYDSMAELAKHGSSFETVKYWCLRAQERAAELVDSIPLWAPMSVKGFKRGWTGLINERGYGIDNYWSFLNMSIPIGLDNTIDYGLDNHPSSLNPISSKILWNWKILGLIYDSLIGSNPFEFGAGARADIGWLAEDWVTGEWSPGKLFVKFTLRLGTVFHNGDSVTPEDVKFSLEFLRACGPGVALAYNDVKSLVRVNTVLDEPSLSPREVKVYFDDNSYWAMHWAGFQPILNHNIWMDANDAYGWGYYRGLVDWTLFSNRWLVENYDPWHADTNGNGKSDLNEDGTGAWVILDVATPNIISLIGNTNFYLSEIYINNFLTWAFHQIGDIDWDGDIDGIDGQIIAKALGTDSSWPWGTGWDMYNPDADINISVWNNANGNGVCGDGSVNYLDIGKWGIHFGEKLDP